MSQKAEQLSERAFIQLYNMQQTVSFLDSVLKLTKHKLLK